MGISDVVNYGTVILWIVAAVIYVARLVRGEVVIPSLLSRILASSIILGVVIALGLIGSAAQVYLYYTKPAKVVEKIVEKPVDRK